MSTKQQGECRYFVTYSGVKLPLKLSNELAPDAINNRNTYFCGYFDMQGRMTGFQKMVYNEVELEHRYQFYDNGALKRAEIIDAEGEATVLMFAPSGQPEQILD